MMGEAILAAVNDAHKTPPPRREAGAFGYRSRYSPNPSSSVTTATRAENRRMTWAVNPFVCQTSRTSSISAPRTLGGAASA